jgi:hypothetical protein
MLNPDYIFPEEPRKKEEIPESRVNYGYRRQLSYNSYDVCVKVVFPKADPEARISTLVVNFGGILRRHWKRCG